MNRRPYPTVHYGDGNRTRPHTRRPHTRVPHVRQWRKVHTPRPRPSSSDTWCGQTLSGPSPHNRPPPVHADPLPAPGSLSGRPRLGDVNPRPNAEWASSRHDLRAILFRGGPGHGTRVRATPRVRQGGACHARLRPRGARVRGAFAGGFHALPPPPRSGVPTSAATSVRMSLSRVRSVLS